MQERPMMAETFATFLGRSSYENHDKITFSSCSWSGSKSLGESAWARKASSSLRRKILIPGQCNINLKQNTETNNVTGIAGGDCCWTFCPNDGALHMTPSLLRCATWWSAGGGIHTLTFYKQGCTHLVWSAANTTNGRLARGDDG